MANLKTAEGGIDLVTIPPFITCVNIGLLGSVTLRWGLEVEYTSICGISDRKDSLWAIVMSEAFSLDSNLCSDS
ncbi:MAG: hypothetical protein WCE93_03140 [Nitrososphaeraceae archaeon]